MFKHDVEKCNEVEGDLNDVLVDKTTGEGREEKALIPLKAAPFPNKVGTTPPPAPVLLKTNDAISCQESASKILLRNTHNGICMSLSMALYHFPPSEMGGFPSLT